MTNHKIKLKLGCQRWRKELLKGFLKSHGMTMSEWYEYVLKDWLDQFEAQPTRVWASPNSSRAEENLGPSIEGTTHARLRALKEQTGHALTDLGWSALIHGFEVFEIDTLEAGLLEQASKRKLGPIMLTAHDYTMVRLCVAMGLHDSMGALLDTAMGAWLGHRASCGLKGLYYEVPAPVERVKRINVSCQTHLYEQVCFWATRDAVGINHAIWSVVSYFLNTHLSADKRDVLTAMEGLKRCR